MEICDKDPGWCKFLILLHVFTTKLNIEMRVSFTCHLGDWPHQCPHLLLSWLEYVHSQRRRHLNIANTKESIQSLLHDNS